MQLWQKQAAQLLASSTCRYTRFCFYIPLHYIPLHRSPAFLHNRCVLLLVQFALDDRSATVQLGGTTAMAAITAELAAPYQGSQREGSVR
jgi:hypothetical protein